MGILGIDNRTENWKTAKEFCDLSDEGVLKLAGHLASTSTDDLGELKMELFWKGVRDWLKRQAVGREKQAREELWNSYIANFSRLRSEICLVRSRRTEPKIRGLEDDNYATHGEATKNKLINNLRNTEFDIVLQLREFLFIGEAKQEATFHASSRFVLVHQLVRQFVTARVLLDVTGNNKTLVPFVVGNRRAHLLNTSQVRLMTKLRIEDGDGLWMREDNVLTWDWLGVIATRNC